MLPHFNKLSSNINIRSLHAQSCTAINVEIMINFTQSTNKMLAQAKLVEN